MERGVATRQLLFEKEIVKMPVEQSPVHIEQDVVDLVPIEEVLRTECWVLSHWESISEADREDELVVFAKILMLRSRHDSPCHAPRKHPHRQHQYRQQQRLARLLWPLSVAPTSASQPFLIACLAKGQLSWTTFQVLPGIATMPTLPIEIGRSAWWIRGAWTLRPQKACWPSSNVNRNSPLPKRTFWS